MDVRSLKGIAVISIEHGEKVGTVDNALFDLDSRRVVAFRIRKSSFPGTARQLISMDDVQNIGPDAVMIQNKDSLRNEKEDREFHNRPDLAAISTLRAVTQDGTYVGNVSTVQFDQKSGNLTAIETTGGGFMDLLRRPKVIGMSEVISIGADVVVVPDQYASGSPRQEQNDTAEADTVYQLPAKSDDTRHQ